MSIHIAFVILLLIIQFILLRMDIVKVTYVRLRNKWTKPWYKINETVIYNKKRYEVIFVFDSDWFYKYYLCRIDEGTHFGRCDTVYQHKLHKKTLLEKELEKT